MTYKVFYPYFQDTRKLFLKHFLYSLQHPPHAAVTHIMHTTGVNSLSCTVIIQVAQLQSKYPPDIKDRANNKHDFCSAPRLDVNSFHTRL